MIEATQDTALQTAERPPEGGWTHLIAEVAEGKWTSPVSGKTCPQAATRSIVVADSLEGREADLVRGVAEEASLALVADIDTWEAMGRRISGALSAAGMTHAQVILGKRPHADLATVATLADQLTGAGHVISVGSGTLNDLCKQVTRDDGRSCSVFATAASMDGYTSSTASMTLDSGLKVSLPSHAPKGAFFDLGVIAAAPARMAAAGFGDCLCSSVARIDWWMSHCLLGTPFWEEPYLIAEENDREMMARAAGIGRGRVTDVGYLVRALILSGLGVNITKVSNHGSMGEHQISHYIDCFAGARHPGSLHGQQVGVASLTMARLQAELLAQDTAPVLRATWIDLPDMERRMGPAIAAQCVEEYRKKALDAEGAARMTARLAELWPDIRRDCLAVAVPVDVMRDALQAAGGSLNAADMGLDPAFYREAVRFGHEMRNRYSFADLACDAGLLDAFAAREG
jgi:glycerol-1-phosphate dehydrogenase [NAD(P)+]